MDEIQKLEKILRDKGLTEKQIKAGVKYYMNFASKFNIPISKAANIIFNMINNMRERYEKIS